MNYAKIHAGYLHTSRGAITTIEVDISFGLHSFSIVGLGDKAIEEAKDRIGAAIKNTGYTSPKQKNQKVIISLTPAHIKKEGSYFDVAMALGYLLAAGQIDYDTTKKIYVGELGLDGQIRPNKGILPILKEAKEAGYIEFFIPIENSQEAGLLTDITIYPVKNLKEIIDHIKGEKFLSKLQPTIIKDERIFLHNISSIQGLEHVKRALEISATGFHSIGLYGPAGTGKTTLIKIFSELLPRPSIQEMLEINSIHSSAGLLNKPITHRPFRAPHHTSSYTAILGGGAFPRPGEISLAHRGILFLDEFPHFDRRVIDGLREPLEEKLVRIARAKETIIFPASILLAIAMNPCLCGNFGSIEEKCRCSSYDVIMYQKKLSGPIIDRIHMWAHVPKTNIEQKIQKKIHKSPSTSLSIAHKIQQGHDFRRNTTITFSEDALSTLREAVRIYHLSPRTYKKLASVAKTIAALEQSKIITNENIIEALTYRPKGIGRYN